MQSKNGSRLRQMALHFLLPMAVSRIAERVYVAPLSIMLDHLIYAAQPEPLASLAVFFAGFFSALPL